MRKKESHENATQPSRLNWLWLFHNLRYILIHIVSEWESISWWDGDAGQTKAVMTYALIHHEDPYNPQPVRMGQDMSLMIWSTCFSCCRRSHPLMGYVSLVINISPFSIKLLVDPAKMVNGFNFKSTKNGLDWTGTRNLLLRICIQMIGGKIAIQFSYRRRI